MHHLMVLLSKEKRLNKQVLKMLESEAFYEFSLLRNELVHSHALSSAGAPAQKFAEFAGRLLTLIP